MTTLHTIVDNIVTRLALMESNALLPDVVVASKSWIYEQQTFPYFINRCSGLSNPSQFYWELGVTARLVIAHVSQAYVGTTNPQDNSWGYIASVMEYLINNDNLDISGQTALSYLDPVGATIDCPNGMSVAIQNIPGKPVTSIVFADFEIVVPIQLGS